MQGFLAIIFLFLTAILSTSCGEVYLDERFVDGDGWEKRWISSTHKKHEAGEFKLSSGKFYGDIEKDKGLQTSQDARFYGLSAKLSKPLNMAENTLVVQFSVKHEQNIDCGGGYIKLFDCSLDPKDMHGDSPYKIMFGPDICGPSSKRVHVIFNNKDKNHLITKEIKCMDDEYSHLYTLIVKADEGTYEVLIDNESKQNGRLDEDWDMLAPKKIEDPESKKPEDWVDNEMIPDPEDTKPDDWDVAEHIPDPDATKPEDWDDETDGEWEAGMIDNPEYKGEWEPKQIANPAYKGKWVHPMIDNPDYDAEASKNLVKYKEICYLGFDLWQVKSGTIFDNILVTNSVEEAKKVAEETWELTKGPERKMKEEQDEAERKAAEEEEKNNPKPDDDDDDSTEADDEDLDDIDEESESPRDEL